MDEYHPEYESFDSVDQEQYQLFDESMNLIPENYEIVRHNIDDNLNATCFQLTHHLHLMGILSSAVKMNPVRRSWEQILEDTE